MYSILPFSPTNQHNVTMKVNVRSLVSSSTEFLSILKILEEAIMGSVTMLEPLLATHDS